MLLLRQRMELRNRLHAQRQPQWQQNWQRNGNPLKIPKTKKADAHERSGLPEPRRDAHASHAQLPP